MKKKKKNSRKLKREKQEKLSLRGKRSRTRSLLSLSERTQIGAAHGETAEKDLLTGTLKHRKKAEQNKIKCKKMTTAPGKTKQQLWLGMRFVMR